jgi:methionine-rich copper-binding protein CopC
LHSRGISIDSTNLPLETPLNGRKGLVTIASALFCAVSIAAATASAKALHLALSRTVPPKDSVTTVVPTAIKLYFTEPVKTAVSGIKLIAPDSSNVELAPLTLGTEKIAPLVATVKGKMADGKYKVMWRTLGTDGHAMTGDYTFTLKAATRSGG